MLEEKSSTQIFQLLTTMCKLSSTSTARSFSNMLSHVVWVKSYVSFKTFRVVHEIIRTLFSSATSNNVGFIYIAFNIIYLYNILQNHPGYQ